LKGIAIACALLGGAAATWGSGYLGLRALASSCKGHNTIRRTKDRVKVIRAGAEDYVIDNLPCPTLDELVDRKYVPRGVRLDPWGTRFFLECNPDGIHSVSVSSAGPDRVFGTPDDVTSDDL
jgi:hypothetical protein